MHLQCLIAVFIIVSLTGVPGRGADAPATDAEVRASIRVSLTFLERGGVAWIKERRCASCHHVPFLLWSHYEAQQRGFPMDAGKLEIWNDWMLVDMLARGDGGGLETLAQALLGRDRSSPWRQKPLRHRKTVDPYER